MQNDWRLRGQEDYMQGMAFKRVKFSAPFNESLHTHCDFCWKKITEEIDLIPDSTNIAYLSLDNRYWVCKECFRDFKHQLHFVVIND